MAENVEEFEGRLLVPSTVIPETCYLMGAHLGPRVEQGEDARPYALLP